MNVNPDYKDLLRILNTCRVRYLVVGAHALAVHTEPRYTKDLDVWVEPTPKNAEQIWEALRAFGAPLQEVTLADFTNPELIYQIGIAPNRIDIMMGISGVQFSTAWRNKKRAQYGQTSINIIGRRDLMRNKRAAQRPQDLVDLAALRASLKLSGQQRGKHTRK